jgi:hypothetical protein
MHEDDKGIRNFNHLSQKANLKHIIFSEPILSLFILSLLYPCISLKLFIFFPLFPWPRISRAYTCDISWNYGWKLCEKKEVMLDEKMGKVAKGEKEQKKNKKKKGTKKKRRTKLPKEKKREKEKNKKRKKKRKKERKEIEKSLKSKEAKHWCLKIEN